MKLLPIKPGFHGCAVQIGILVAGFGWAVAGEAEGMVAIFGRWKMFWTGLQPFYDVSIRVWRFQFTLGISPRLAWFLAHPKLFARLNRFTLCWPKRFYYFGTLENWP